MPYRLETIEPHTFYHIYNRGNNKQKIFFEQENYLYFMRLFRKYLEKYDIDLHAYCLMPNHFHLLVQTGIASNVPQMMHDMMIAYVKAINKRYDRIGHLFQNRYKIKPVQSTEYLLHLSRYIHTNPFFAKLVTVAQDWKYSSYKNYISNAVEDKLSTQFILSHFGMKNNYQAFVESFIEEKFNEMQREF